MKCRPRLDFQSEKMRNKLNVPAIFIGLIWTFENVFVKFPVLNSLLTPYSEVIIFACSYITWEFDRVSLARLASIHGNTRKKQQQKPNNNDKFIWRNGDKDQFANKLE